MPADVQAAAAVLDGVAHRTPVLTSRTLDELSGATVFLKAEHLQRGGAFKFRGAYHAISRLSPDRRACGVVAYSSGNHAQAVALAAALFGVPATIVMPTDAPVAKRAATAGYGATIIDYDRAHEDRAAIAAAVARRTGAHLVAPYDDYDVIAGAGTAARELLADVDALDVLVVPVGGGGLLAGTLLAAQAGSPPPRVYGVEPQTADDTARSLDAGERVRIAQPDTIADCLAVTTPGELTFPIVSAYAAGVLTVSEEALVEGVRFAVERLHQVIEPGSAAPLAALMSRNVPDMAGKRIGVVLSGGNVGSERLGELLRR